jgi:hypothetical protein
MTGDGHPMTGDGHLRTFTDLAGAILALEPRNGVIRVVAVDGGSASGKSTFAGRLATHLDAAVVHTDDVAG